MSIQYVPTVEMLSNIKLLSTKFTFIYYNL